MSETMDALRPEENKMGTMPVNKLLLTMSLPMVISMLIQALYNVVDSIFCGADRGNSPYCSLPCLSHSKPDHCNRRRHRRGG